MIGVVRPLTIRCNPRWNGAIMPLRVSCPSGKTQTTWPSSRAFPASRKAWRIIFGPPLGEIGIAFIERRNQPMIGRSKYEA